MNKPMPTTVTVIKPPAPVPVTAPLDPVSQESWNALTLQQIAKILEMPNPADNPMRNLPAWAQTQMDELKLLRKRK